MKLTLKQQRFIQFYDGNGREAAIKAGYNKRTARQMGSENLSKPYIKEAIDKRINKKDTPKIMTRQERQELWSQFANDITKEDSIRLKAMELLGKSQADFTENINHSGAIDIQEIFNGYDLSEIFALKNRLLESKNVALSN